MYAALDGHGVKRIDQLRALKQGIAHHNNEDEDRAKGAKLSPELLFAVVGQQDVSTVHIEGQALVINVSGDEVTLLLEVVLYSSFHLD